MSQEGQTSHPPSRRSLGWITLGSLAAASVTFILFVLPVEFSADPTGFGRLTGLDQLAAAVAWTEVPVPEGGQEIARFYDTPFRTDTIEIPIGANDGDLEYKLRMKGGDSIIYSWQVQEIENPEWFYSEFHGHTEPSPGEVGNVMFYRKDVGASENGSFIAPFEGIHGWYLQNQSTKPVVVRLELAGFYELIPDQLP